MAHSRPRWYPLDHSAKIWPALLSGRSTSLFRISAVLKEPVVWDSLRDALNALQTRFPYFSVKLHRGLFWYYLEENAEGGFALEADSQWPCMAYRELKSRRSLLRVLVHGRRISVEVSHVLTDGMGALQFLRALVYEYLVREKGIIPPGMEAAAREAQSPGPGASGQTPEQEPAADFGARPPDLPPRPGETVPPHEWHDSYLEHGMKGAPTKPLREKAFHLPFALLRRGEYRIISGHLSLQAVRDKAKSFRLSVSEYLVSILFMAYQDYWLALRRVNRKTPAALSRPLRIIVPVNLRGIFRSGTLRNFFVYVDPELDPRMGEYSLPEIMYYVHHYMRGEKHRQNLKRHFARHARTEQSLPVRMVPLALKNLILALNLWVQGDTRYTTSFSNIGSFELPPDAMAHVDWADFYPPPSPILRQAVSVISCGDVLSVSFGKMIGETVIEKRFFRLLRDQGLDVRILANFQGGSHELLS